MYILIYIFVYLRRQNVTTSMVELKNGHMHKNLTKKKKVNPIDIARNAETEEEEEEEVNECLTDKCLSTQ